MYGWIKKLMSLLPSLALPFRPTAVIQHDDKLFVDSRRKKAWNHTANDDIIMYYTIGHTQQPGLGDYVGVMEKEKPR